MPLKIKMLLVLMLTNIFLFTTKLQAAQSIWPNLNTLSAQNTTSYYKNKRCSKQAPTPFTGPLLIESKYDQTDSSKSTLVTTSANSKKIVAEVKGYIGGLLAISKDYKKAKNTEQADLALACLSQWLDNWARADALLNTEATKTGIAGRKWALAAISSIILNVKAYSNGKYDITPLQKAWLTKLANQVITEYQPRRKPNFTGYFNNHDYWAGWAIAATAMVINNDEMLTWAHGSLKRALQQVIISDDGSYAWLPYEVARGKLGADYSNYAMVPLSLLANTAKVNQLPITDDELNRLQLLANFTARTTLDPKSLPQLAGSQKSFSSQKMVWLIPFIEMYPDNKLTKDAYSKKNGNVDNYSQIGGTIKNYYPRVQ